MLKLIAILTAFCLALAVSVQAAKPEDQNQKSEQKAKTAASKQHIVPRQQQMQQQQSQLKAPKTHVQKLQTPRTDSTKVTKEKIETLRTQKELPAVQKSQEQLQTNTQQLQKNKLSKETVQKIQSQHVNFKAKPNTAIASVQFNPNYRIEAAQNWNGTQYNVFRSYQPQWHDQGWWTSHYTSLSLIGGGWYYWNDGYWYPAWGYDEVAAYYPYDGPIYVGPRARPFDQVVADVQAVLQEQGYYKGEVDGLVGPLTREALAAYQSAQNLPPTAAIDQPTLESLGLAG